jgi:hypothetical protein
LDNAAEAYDLAVTQGLNFGSIERFKKQLGEAARQSLIELERCDVAGALPKDALLYSRLCFGPDERHFIVSGNL